MLAFFVPFAMFQLVLAAALGGSQMAVAVFGKWRYRGVVCPILAVAAWCAFVFLNGQTEPLAKGLFAAPPVLLWPLALAEGWLAGEKRKARKK